MYGQYSRLRILLLGGITAFLAPAAGHSETLVSTHGPFLWTDACTGGEASITVRVYKDVPGFPGLFKWDYEIHNVSLQNPPSSEEVAWGVDGIGWFSLLWLHAVPELDNPSPPAGWDTFLEANAGWVEAFSSWEDLGESWEPEGQLAGILAGSTGHFAFTTLPREAVTLPPGQDGNPPGGYLGMARLRWPPWKVLTSFASTWQPPLRAECYDGFPDTVTGPIVFPGPELVSIKLEQEGETTISTDGKYSEDTTVRVTTVKASTGETVTTFSGVANIEENGAVHIYSQNGGSLPSSVVLTEGTGTFVAKSLADPAGEGELGQKPPDASITVTSHPVYGSDLLIPQWIISGQQIDPRANGPVFDWVQQRAKDIFDSASGDVATVLSAVSHYSIEAMADAGRTDWVRGPQSPIVINPYYSRSRLDTSSGAVWCETVDSKWFTNTLLHEARHAYQASQAVVSENDVDGDFLVNTISITPLDFFVDTTANRLVCNHGTTETRAYHGDTIFDQPEAPDYASYAWEMDAWIFGEMHDH